MGSVRVRMYRQGLGDCFLLTMDAGDDGQRHLLIDCGVLMGTPDSEARMREVAESIRETTGGHLDVLVSTHEHWDHLSGFLEAQDVFDAFDVDEVWLAWTEDPEDDLADELRRHRRRALNALAAARDQLAAADSAQAGAAAQRLGAVLGFHGDLAAGAKKTTANALAWVKRRDARVRYLRPGELLPALGVDAYVLGPPHDRTLIKRSDPSKRDSEVYELAGADGVERGFLAAVESRGRPDVAEAQPFEGWRRMGTAEAGRQKVVADSYLAPDSDWRRIDHDWLGAAGSLALALDSDTNNTSLVLAFELSPGGPVLLFPGDAQVGNWLSWGALEWPNGTAGGTLRADDLLARTVLYKVGHHGSHNATLREHGLERMTSLELAAMIPVSREMAHRKKWNMPFPPLLARLHEKTRGRVIDADLGIGTERPAGLSEERWERFRRSTDVQPGWVDHTVEW
jgi:hypothetical protein